MSFDINGYTTIPNRLLMEFIFYEMAFKKVRGQFGSKAGIGWYNGARSFWIECEEFVKKLRAGEIK